jgi:hypothetical protein
MVVYSIANLTAMYHDGILYSAVNYTKLQCIVLISSISARELYKVFIYLKDRYFLCLGYRFRKSNIWFFSSETEKYDFVTAPSCC